MPLLYTKSTTVLETSRRGAGLVGQTIWYPPCTVQLSKGETDTMLYFEMLLGGFILTVRSHAVSKEPWNVPLKERCDHLPSKSLLLASGTKSVSSKSSPSKDPSFQPKFSFAPPCSLH
eukprot:767779-Hanusia_phi.AAC.11